MALMQIKCPNCGAEIEFDNEKETGECKYCHGKFLNKKDNETNTYIIEKQININIGENQNEKEKKQYEVLLMMLKNFDLTNLKYKALEVLDINPNNELAKMIYHLNFEFYELLEGEITSYSFSSILITEYFEKYRGTIDSETSVIFISLLLQKYDFDEEDSSCMNAILANLESFSGNNKEVFDFYKNVIQLAKTGSPTLKQVKKIERKIPKGITTFLLTDNEYLAADAAEYRKEVRRAKSILEKSHKNFLKSIIESFKQSNKLNESEKKKLKIYANRDKLIGIVLGIITFIMFLIIFLVK